MAIQGITNQRINDIGGGMNTYLSPSSLTTTECVLLQNGITEGASIKSIPGAVQYDTPDLDDLMGKIDASAPSMVYSANMSTVCIVPFGDWIFQMITPTDSGAVGYNYLAIRAFNKRLNIDKTTITLVGISGLASLKMSGMAFNMGDIYLCLWASGTSNSELYAFKIDTTTPDGVITAWNSGTGGITGTVSTAVFGTKTCAMYEQRLLIGGNPTNPSAVYFSKAGSVANPEYLFDFTSAGSGIALIGGIGRVSSIFKNNDNLFIGTDNGIFKGTFTETAVAGIYNLNTLPFSNSSILSHDSVCDVNQDTIFFDGFDVRRLSYEQNILALKDSSISDKIRNTIKLLPSSKKRDNILSSFLFPLYKLYCCSTFANVNDIAFVYNVIDKSWSVESINVKSAGISSYNQKTLLTTNGSLDILEVKDVDGNDGDAKTFKYLSGEFVFGDDVDYKRFVQYEVFGEITDEVQATIYIYIDGNLKYQKDTTFKPLSTPTTGATTFGSSLFGSNSAQDTSSQFRERLDFFFEGRSIQVGIECTEISRIKIDGHNFQYKFIQAYPIH